MKKKCSVSIIEVNTNGLYTINIHENNSTEIEIINVYNRPRFQQYILDYTNTESIETIDKVFLVVCKLKDKFGYKETTSAKVDISGSISSDNIDIKIMLDALANVCKGTSLVLQGKQISDTANEELKKFLE